MGETIAERKARILADNGNAARMEANGESPGLLVASVPERRTRNTTPYFGTRIGAPAEPAVPDEPAVVMAAFTGGEDTYYDVTGQVTITGDPEVCWIVRNIIKQHTRNKITAVPRDRSGGEAQIRFNVTFHASS